MEYESGEHDLVEHLVKHRSPDFAFRTKQLEMSNFCRQLQPNDMSRNLMTGT